MRGTLKPSDTELELALHEALAGLRHESRGPSVYGVTRQTSVVPDILYRSTLVPFQ